MHFQWLYEKSAMLNEEINQQAKKKKSTKYYERKT